MARLIGGEPGGMNLGQRRVSLELRCWTCRRGRERVGLRCHQTACPTGRLSATRWVGQPVLQAGRGSQSFSGHSPAFQQQTHQGACLGPTPGGTSPHLVMSDHIRPLLPREGHCPVLCVHRRADRSCHSPGPRTRLTAGGHSTQRGPELCLHPHQQEQPA